MKKVPLIVISDDDDDEQDEPKTKKHKTVLKRGRIANNNDVHMTFLDNKKAYEKEIQKIENLETNDESPIGLNTYKKNLNFNEDFVNLFDEEANDVAEPKPETLTEATKDFPSLDDFADESGEYL
ncbi:hypothetical protein Tco_0963263 [Tanacetum coccineum]